MLPKYQQQYSMLSAGAYHGLSPYRSSFVHATPCRRHSPIVGSLLSAQTKLRDVIRLVTSFLQFEINYIV